MVAYLSAYSSLLKVYQFFLISGFNKVFVFPQKLRYLENLK